jgi:hypothetical protein
MSSLRSYTAAIIGLSRREALAREWAIKSASRGADYPGIEMNSLPDGLRAEASMNVVVAHKVNLIATSVEPKKITCGKTQK